MKTLKKNIFVALMLCATMPAFSQKRMLKIGDTLPDVTLKMYNYQTPVAKISDFKGKAIVLDFWATWCAPCVASFPKLNKLQEKFKDDLVILPVSYEAQAHIAEFGERLKKYKSVSYYSVVEDNTLSKLFPHSTVPHYVWINKNGIVKAITYPEAVNEQNIQKLIANNNLDEAVKSDRQRRINPFEPILRDTTLHSFRALAHYIEGVGGGTSFAAGGNIHGNTILLSNNSLLNLFQVAYGGKDFLKFMMGFKSIKLVTQDSARFTDYTGYGKFNAAYSAEWLRKNGLNYALKVPADQAAEKWSIMKEDLKQYYPEISARIIREDRPALILKRTNNELKFAAKTKGDYKSAQNATSLTVENGSMRGLTGMLAYYFQNTPYFFYDETNYQNAIDINLQGDMGNLDSLNAALKAYGLKLEKENRNAEVLEVIDHGKLSASK